MAARDPPLSRQKHKRPKPQIIIITSDYSSLRTMDAQLRVLRRGMDAVWVYVSECVCVCVCEDAWLKNQITLWLLTRHNRCWVYIRAKASGGSKGQAVVQLKSWPEHISIVSMEQCYVTPGCPPKSGRAAASCPHAAPSVESQTSNGWLFKKRGGWL